MKKILLAAAFALMALLPSHADAQTVFRQPTFVAANNWADFGNGPTELLAVEGSAIGYTSMSSGTGSTSGSSTTLTLTATPGAPPCVGCIISGAGITSGTTVTATSTNTITMSAAMTVASTTVSWGVACQANGTFPTAPSAAGNTLSAPLNLRAAVGSTGAGLATPVYSTARICVYGGQQQGGTLVNFPIGAW